uniref:Xylogen-like protein 11 n=1 Tax=Anthurium amnicola TaxID=1678845 RepID=A0A1D1YM78_9ARAE
MARCGWLVLCVMFAVGFHSGVTQGQGPSLAPSPSAETALAPGPAASKDCMTTLLDSMSSCLAYVEAGSNLSRPEKGCCRGLADVVNSQPLCLCSLLASKDVYGFQIDRTKALMLPTVCRVQTPPVSVCSAMGIPVPSPAGSNTPAASAVGPPVAGGPAAAAIPPAGGGGVDLNFRSSALAFLAGLSIAAAVIF